MNFGFTEEQELLRHQVRKLLDEQCPLSEVRKLAESPQGYSPELWKQMGELGWLGLLIPEKYGGAELEWVDLVVLLEETGKSLHPSPLLSNTLAASVLLDAGNEAQCAERLPGLADGSTIATPALLEESDLPRADAIALRGKPDGDGFRLRGTKCFVTDPEAADFFVVAFRTGDDPDAVTLGLVDAKAKGVSAKAFPMIDQTKRLGNVSFDDVQVSADDLLGAPGCAASAIGTLFDRSAVALCAEMLGAAQAALDLTVQYAKDRIQFGSPIGRFQGVKHPLAEMHQQLESAKSLLYFAAWAVDRSPDELARAASRAKGYASDVFARIGMDSIQIHGTIAYTNEYDAQLFLKRSKWARPLFGDSAYHYDRLITLRGF